MWLSSLLFYGRLFLGSKLVVWFEFYLILSRETSPKVPWVRGELSGEEEKSLEEAIKVKSSTLILSEINSVKWK